MKKVYYLLLIFCLGCKQTPKNLLYFNYDEIEHYQREVSIEDLRKENKTQEEKNLEKVTMFSAPSTLTDTIYINAIQQFYQKTNVDPKYFDDINSVYQVKTNGFDWRVSCAPIYRDILIFKKNHKIVGISKLCFECGIQYTIGTNKDTYNLCHTPGDWDTLDRIFGYERKALDMSSKKSPNAPAPKTKAQL